MEKLLLNILLRHYRLILGIIFEILKKVTYCSFNWHHYLKHSDFTLNNTNKGVILAVLRDDSSPISALSLMNVHRNCILLYFTWHYEEIYFGRIMVIILRSILIIISQLSKDSFTYLYPLESIDNRDNFEFFQLPVLSATNFYLFKPGFGHVGFCDGQKWRWSRFSPRTSVSRANLHSTCFSTIIFTITWGWHNRPGVAAVPMASQTK
jgi:hypothetical protein